MDISKIISVDTVKNKISCASKKKLFELISGLASAKLDVPADGLLDALFQREKLGTTYCGKGVAIPHGTFESDRDKSLQAYSSPSTSRLSSAARGRWRA